MPQTYFDSALTGEQIEAALEAVNGIASMTNNGKILYINNGRIDAKSAAEWADVPVLEPVTITQNGTTTPPADVDGFNSVTVNVQGGGGEAVVQPLNVTQNGTYNPPSGVDGYAPVTVSVSGGSSGEGPIYYGTSVPDASIGINEDLYIQYEAKSIKYNHTYKIAAQYRKVNGSWTQYSDPIPPTHGVHIWTKSIGGNDAAMYIQEGYWDSNNNVFVSIGEIESILYTTVRNWNSARDCYGLALLAYPDYWRVKASTTLTDGTSVYQADQEVANWGFTTYKDLYLWIPD